MVQSEPEDPIQHAFLQSEESQSALKPVRHTIHFSLNVTSEQVYKMETPESPYLPLDFQSTFLPSLSTNVHPEDHICLS